MSENYNHMFAVNAIVWDNKLKAISAAIDQVLLTTTSFRPTKICIIDPPNHPNVGDSAIFLGELAAIARCFKEPEIIFFDIDTYTESADPAIERSDLIFIHGGGNFGDLWPLHHQLRCRIIEKFAHKRVVQLSQSIYFSSEREVASTAKSLSGKSLFTLFVRDTRSLAFAKSKFECDVRLVPDMAFALGPLKRAQPVADFFCLLRTDKEISSDHLSILAAIRSTGSSLKSGDWLSETPTVTKLADKLARRYCKKYPMNGKAVAATLLEIRRKSALDRLRRGSALLSMGKTVVTDRLHGHILCCLLGLRHYLFDSLDGKVSALYETWTSANENAIFVPRGTDFASLLAFVASGASDRSRELS